MQRLLALPLLVMLGHGCAAGSLAPRLSVTVGRSITRGRDEGGHDAQVNRYALITAKLSRQPPAPPLVVTRPASTPLPDPPACLESAICGAVERARLLSMRREAAREPER